MKLHAALRASKIRRARSPHLVSGLGNILGPFGDETAVEADDGGITYVVASPDTPNNYSIETCEKSWAAMLPDLRAQLLALDWEPLDPKPTLSQLAETLTDFSEDD